MKAILAALFILTANLPAQWLVLKPTELEPLTSVPWEEKDATMEKVLNAIFREPNMEIRHSVLLEYLRQIKAADMGHAFDLCVPLEGTQNPDQLVALFIRVWDERDPDACWAWVKKLFHVVGMDHDVLGYDSWKYKLTVRDLEAVRASLFWISSRALEGFPVAISHSKLEKDERVRIMKEFIAMWFNAFPWWPEPDARDNVPERGDGPDALRPLIEMLRRPIAPDMLSALGKSDSAAPLYEIAFRRMLKADPMSAPGIVKRAGDKGLLPPKMQAEGLSAPSYDLLLIWAKSDLPGMVRWAESLDGSESELAFRAKGLMMALVEPAKRKEWIAQMKSVPAEENHLYEEWAKWDIEGALLAAADAGDVDSINNLANEGVYGPWFGQPCNQSRHAMQVLSRFDYSKLPPKIHERVFNDNYSLMEQWDSIDPAGAARFGFAYLRRTNYAPRAGLIQFFSGKDIYGGEDGMIDRTFCALRVWAVVRPDEMKKWIATIKDTEMRKALTWLLENPWGTGEEE